MALDVRLVTPSEMRVALSLLWAHLPPHERQQQVTSVLGGGPEAPPLSGVWAAWQGDSLQAVLYSVPQPDQTVLFWPPVIDEALWSQPQLALATARSLLQGARAAWEHAGVQLAQCLSDIEDRVSHSLLEASGFESLAVLHYLALQEPFPDQPATTTPLGKVPFSESQRSRFEALLERTYLDSRDCPRLSQYRSAQQALVGHALSGEFHPELWTLYTSPTSPAEDAGLLLLALQPAHASLELVYCGLAPEFRGQGRGRQLLIDTIQAARERGLAHIQVAVDAANTPACELYRRFGFSETFRRQVHMWFGLPPRAESHSSAREN